MDAFQRTQVNKPNRSQSVNTKRPLRFAFSSCPLQYHLEFQNFCVHVYVSVFLWMCVHLHVKWEIYYTAKQGLVLHTRKRERMLEKCPRPQHAVLLARLLMEWSTVEWTTAIFFLTKLFKIHNGLNFDGLQGTNNTTLKKQPCSTLKPGNCFNWQHMQLWITNIQHPFSHFVHVSGERWYFFICYMVYF